MHGKTNHVRCKVLTTMLFHSTVDIHFAPRPGQVRLFQYIPHHYLQSSAFFWQFDIHGCRFMVVMYMYICTYVLRIVHQSASILKHTAATVYCLYQRLRIRSCLKRLPCVGWLHLPPFYFTETEGPVYPINTKWKLQYPEIYTQAEFTV